MRRGDAVTYLAHPEWGSGIIEFVAPNALLTVSFEIDREPYRDDFSPHELEIIPLTQTGLPKATA
jgi:hypothetical protein